MRPSAIALLAFICAMCMVDEGTGTDLTRVTRTIPFELLPKGWPHTVKNFVLDGGILQLPRSTANSLWRLLSGPNTQKMSFTFRPEDGQRAAYMYQQRYGYRGQWLIELLGSGFHPDSLRLQPPLPSFRLTPPPPPS